MTDAALAAGWAFAGFRELTRNSAPRPADERRRDQLARSVLRHLATVRPPLTRATSP